MKRAFLILLLTLLALVSFVFVGCNKKEKSESEYWPVAQRSVDPYLRREAAGIVFSTDASSATTEERIMLEAAAGIAARNSVAALVLAAPEDYFLLRRIQENGYKTQALSVKNFVQNIIIKCDVQGYVLYDESHINDGLTAAGEQQALPLQKSMLDQYGEGLEMQVDATMGYDSNASLVFGPGDSVSFGVMNGAAFGDISQGLFCRNLAAVSILNGAVDQDLSVTVAQNHCITVISELDTAYFQETAVGSATLLQAAGRGSSYLADGIIADLRFGGSDAKAEQKFIDEAVWKISESGVAYGFLNDGAMLDYVSKTGIFGGILDGFCGAKTVNGKKYAGITATLKEDNFQNIAASINASPTDGSIDSFTTVYVEDGVGIETLQRFYALLDSDVQVLSLHDFLKLVPDGNRNFIMKEVSVPDEYEKFDMYGMRYSVPSTNLNYLFSGNVGQANVSAPHGYDLRDGVLYYTVNTDAYNGYFFTKVETPEWPEIWLNVSVQTTIEVGLKIALVKTDGSILTIWDDNLKNKNFQVISLMLGEPGVYGVLLELNSAKAVGQVGIDYLRFTKSSLRDPSFDLPVMQSNDISNEDKYWHTTGNVRVSEGSLFMEAGKPQYSDEATATASARVFIPESAKVSTFLKIMCEAQESIDFRVVVIDSNYNTIMLKEWICVSESGQYTFDLSAFVGQTIVLRLESKSSPDSLTRDKSLTITKLEMQTKQEQYMYPVNTTDYFTGSKSIWNLCGWQISGGATYGDLTYDPMYGSLRLDGSNNGVFDENIVLSRAMKWYDLSESSMATLQFYVRSGSAVNDTFFRVRAVDESDAVVVLTSGIAGWTLVAGEAWTEYNLDCSMLAGKRVRIMIEQTDNGDGIGEIAFFDCIRIIASD